MANSDYTRRDYAIELTNLAKSIPKKERQQILEDIPETEMHSHLATLFGILEPNFLIAVTHGNKELGKDLVMVRQGAITSNVIAVVVKRGSMKGVTGGDVDEIIEAVDKVLPKRLTKQGKIIKSQVVQALAHKAELPQLLRKLPVTEVLVLIVGELGGNSRKRLEAEMPNKKIVDIHDVDWLVNEFTDHYPQIFFHGKTIDFLQRQIERCREREALVRLDKSFAECFIQPVLALWDEVSIEGSNLSVGLSKKPVNFDKLISFLTVEKPIMLIGDAGTGKSTALAKFALHMLEQSYAGAKRSQAMKDIAQVPLLVTFNDLRTCDNADDLFDKAGLHEDKHLFVASALLVDGLDEVPSAERQQLLDKAKAFSRDLSLPLLMTSRKIDIVRNTMSGITRIELEHFGVSQALQLFEQMRRGQKDLKALKDGLMRIKNQIPMIPLSLLLLVKIVEEHHEVPSTLTELYDRFVDAVLGRFDKEKGITVLFEYAIKKKFLSALAYHTFVKSNVLTLKKEDFNNFVLSYIGRYDIGSDKMEEFVGDVERAGIIEIGNEVRFKHRSFLDYFAAFYLTDNFEEFADLNSMLVEWYYSDFWSNVTFFYIGLRKKITQNLLDLLFEHKETNLEDRISKFVIGKLIQAGWHSESKVKYDGVVRGLNYLPSLRSEIATLLSKHEDLPRYLNEAIILSLADVGYRSGFMVGEVKKRFTELGKISSYDIALSKLVLIWGVYPLLDSDESFLLIEEFAKEISGCEHDVLDQPQKAKLFLLLGVVDVANPNLQKSVERHLKRIAGKNPTVFRALEGKKKKTSPSK